MPTTTEIGLSEVICPTCNILFWIPTSHKERCQKDHNTIYCPNGHPLYYPKETEGDRLRKLLLEKESTLKKVVNERDKAREELTRAKRRYPYCWRYFKNLERHIEIKHPESNG